MTLTQLFDLSLTGRREQTALEFQGREFTFGEIEARANRMANALIARGFEPGDRLAVQLANCVGFIDLYLACTRTGIIFVPVNILYKEREVSHILHDAGPRLFVTQSNLPELSSDAARPSSALTVTARPRLCTRPAPPASRKARSSRTTTSLRTR
jgi:malonyl-CoA/methylmalonyl-CoA synthetase